MSKENIETTRPKIALAPIKRLMKKEGAGLVSKDAALFLTKYLEKEAIKVTKAAVKNMKEEKRKRLQGSDIKFVTPIST